MIKHDDCEIEYFYTTFQKLNETPVGCRIYHKPTGLYAESIVYRQKYQNYKRAFEDLEWMVLEHVKR